MVGAVPVPIRDEAMPEAVILGPYAGELVFGPDLVSAEDVGALARTFKKRRRKQLLETQWYCAYCKNYTSKEETTCRVCEVPKASAVAHNEAEALRYESRKKLCAGRKHNKAGTGAAATVERAAAGVVDLEERAAAVRAETNQLAVAIGDSQTNSSDEGKVSIIDGFLLGTTGVCTACTRARTRRRGSPERWWRTSTLLFRWFGSVIRGLLEKANGNS